MPTKKSLRSSAKSGQKTSLRKELALKSETSRPRRLRLPAYRLFRLQRIRYPEHLPSSWHIAAEAACLVWRNRWLFLGIAIIYGILNLIFVRGFTGGTDINSLKKQINDAMGGNSGQLVAGVAVFVSLVASSGNSSSSAAGAYQLFLGLVVSLATIWAVRQTVAGHVVRVRDAFYKGIYPLVPFILVLAVILLQTLPFLAGGTLFTLVMNTGIAINGFQVAIFGLIFVVLAIVSVYMLCSSLFALYIVTLPDMTPLKALRSARQLVRYRRGQVLRKLLFLPVVIIVVSVAIMVPVILLFAPAAQWVFFMLSMLWLILTHTYMYTVYKELLA